MQTGPPRTSKNWSIVNTTAVVFPSSGEKKPRFHCCSFPSSGIGCSGASLGLRRSLLLGLASLVLTCTLFPRPFPSPERFFSLFTQPHQYPLLLVSARALRRTSAPQYLPESFFPFGSSPHNHCIPCFPLPSSLDEGLSGFLETFQPASSADFTQYVYLQA